MSEDKPPRVYAAINAITEALSKDGITKSRKNQSQGYQFRGIDDIYNALASELAKNKLCMLPRVLDRAVTERETKNGGVLFYSVVTVEFDLVSAEDGSIHTIRTIGEAMDSGDKSTNKSQSAAYKYAALMAFCIPTEGDNDSENQTHEVAPRQVTRPVSPVAPKSAAPSTKPPSDPKNEFIARANIFGSQIASSVDKSSLDATVARGNKLLLELKTAIPEQYDRLMGEISTRQNSFTASGEAA